MKEEERTSDHPQIDQPGDDSSCPGTPKKVKHKKSDSEEMEDAAMMESLLTRMGEFLRKLS